MSEDASTRGCQKRIYLERFSSENAELVLAWRNAQHVRENSLNDEAIEHQNHLRFVENLKSSTDRNFFIVHISDYPVGVLNVNVSDSIGYWGCYLGGAGNGSARPGLFSILIGLAGVIAFQILDCDKLNSDVVKHNVAPQRMNSFLNIPIVGHREEKRPSGEHIEVINFSLKRQAWPAVLCRLKSTLTTSDRKLLEAFSQSPIISEV